MRDGGNFCRFEQKIEKGKGVEIFRMVRKEGCVREKRKRERREERVTVENMARA